MTNPFDTTTAPLHEPVSIVKGHYVSWRREIDYDDPIKYHLICLDEGTHTVDVAGVQDGAYWVFEITGAISNTFNHVGRYAWELVYVRASDSEEYIAERGYLDVFATDSDRRTHAEIMVAKIESILNGRAAADVESYSIGSRSITKMSVEELTKWRDYYRSEIAITGGSTMNGATKKNTVLVRFN